MLNKAFLLAAVVMLMCFMAFNSMVFAIYPPTYVNGSTVVDLSWPESNCKVANKYITQFAIIGVNGGLDFRSNHCLRVEAGRFFNYALYANTGYPGRGYGLKYVDTPRKCKSSDDYCLAYNYGYNAGKYAVIYADIQNVHSANWWLDVENDNSWTNNTSINRAEIQGEAAAIKQLDVIAAIGIYSYPGQWDVITGNWVNGWPNWVATGSLERSYAKSWCKGQDFTGGSTWLTQYTVVLDEDYVCQTH